MFFRVKGSSREEKKIQNKSVVTMMLQKRLYNTLLCIIQTSLATCCCCRGSNTDLCTVTHTLKIFSTVSVLEVWYIVTLTQ